jgi:hypothetical protein
MTQEEEQRAIGLYAVLARDASDFIDMLEESETTDLTLQWLHAMLTTPNPKSDVELNKIGACFTKRELEKRGLQPLDLSALESEQNEQRTREDDQGDRL